MAHFAILCPDDAGHLLSMGSLGKELVRRGHRVTIVGRERAAPLAEQFELPLHSLGSNGASYSPSFLLGAACYVCRINGQIVMRDFVRWHAETILDLVPPALKELAVDGVLVDQVTAAGGTAAQRAGVPFVTVCTALPWNEEPSVPPPYTSWLYADGRRAQWRNRLGYAGWHWFIRPILGAINRRRRKWNLREFSGIGEVFSPLAQISQLCPGLDFPRTEVPDAFHYIGSLAARRQVNHHDAFPWDRLDGRPLIFASLGTVPDPANLPMFRKLFAACAGLDAQLVLALGRWSDDEDSLRESLGEIPDNAIAVDFAPQLALLDRAALLITHAGVNTVLESLSRAVPMVALPRSADQPGMGSRIAYAGVGLLGSYQQSSAQHIQELVQRVLTEDSFKRRAAELQQAMIAAGGVSRAADIAEQAFATGRPVRRQ